MTRNIISFPPFFRVKIPISSNAPLKKRQSSGASYSVLVWYLHPSKLISDIYSNKDKRNALSGIIIFKREFRRVTGREQLCIFMKRYYSQDKDLRWFKSWFILDIEVYYAHSFKYIVPTWDSYECNDVRRYKWSSGGWLWGWRWLKASAREKPKW